MKATDLRRGDLIDLKWDGAMERCVVLGIDSNANGAFYAVVANAEGARWSIMTPSSDAVDKGWAYLGRTVTNPSELPFQ